MTQILKAATRRIAHWQASLAAIAALTGMWLLGACNSSSDGDYGNYSETQDLSAVTVKSFSLQADNKILYNLDSVFFSINLVKAEVFNADSLPKNTRIDSLLVTLSTSEVSVAQFKFISMETRKDTTVDFLKYPNQSINFSDGPVTLHLESIDGETKRDYKVKINVHLIDPDSLYWARTACRAIPSSLSAVEAQRTVRFKEQAVCLTSSPSDQYSIAFASDPSGAWELKTPVFPASVNVESFTATSEALYILGLDGSLLTSANGTEWTSTGERWTSISAPYGASVVGVKQTDGRYVHTSYPALAIADADVKANFPLSGNSESVVLQTKWAQADQVITCGGRDASGALTGATWAFDGTRWAEIGGGLPAAEGYALTPYTVCRTDTVSWRIIKNDVLLAIGGRGDSCSRAIYLSKDMGMNWRKADKQVQLPDYIPAIYGADALVFDLTIKSSRSGFNEAWRQVGASRAVAPITEWDCPYIYLFGGIDDQQRLQPTVWRGVINHLAFKPLQ